MAEAMRASAEEAVKEIGRILEVPVSRVRRFEGQPREYFDPKEMDELAQSIRVNGQKQPVPVRLVDDGDPDHDYELVDGERRWTACLMAGKSTVEVWVKNVVDREEQFLDSVIYNMARSGHTALEHAHAIERIRRSKKMDGLLEGDKIERIAKIFARSTSWVRQQHSLIRLTPEVQAMMSRSLPEEERLGDSIAAFISSAHPDLQREIAETVLKKKLGINQARLYARQLADRIGGTVGGNKDPRGPRKDYLMLTNYVRKIGEGLSIMSSPQVLARIVRRDPKELAAVATEIEDCIAGLTQLRSELLASQIATPPVPPPLPPPPPPTPPRPRREVQPPPPSADDIQAPPKEFEDKQSLDLTREVWVHLMYSGYIDGGGTAVNLSRKALERMLRGSKVYHGQPMEDVVFNTVMSARHRWGKAISGNPENQDLARRMHAFRRESGNCATFEEAFDRAVSRDRSSDPVRLPAFH